MPTYHSIPVQAEAAQWNGEYLGDGNGGLCASTIIGWARGYAADARYEGGKLQVRTGLNAWRDVNPGDYVIMTSQTVPAPQPDAPDAVLAIAYVRSPEVFAITWAPGPLPV